MAGNAFLPPPAWWQLKLSSACCRRWSILNSSRQLGDLCQTADLLLTTSIMSFAIAASSMNEQGCYLGSTLISIHWKRCIWGFKQRQSRKRFYCAAVCGPEVDYTTKFICNRPSVCPSIHHPSIQAYHRADIQRQTTVHSHIHTDNKSNVYTLPHLSLHVFGLREEAEETPHRKTVLTTEPLCHHSKTVLNQKLHTLLQIKSLLPFLYSLFLYSGVFFV